MLLTCGYALMVMTYVIHRWVQPHMSHFNSIIIIILLERAVIILQD